MATTLYKFQSDLTGLITLNKQLEKANANLNMLKANTAQYAAQSKSIATMASTMNTNTNAIKGTSAAAATLNTRGHRMVSIFKSASIAIVSAFAFRAIIGGIKGVVTAFAKFEAQMAAVKAISKATEVEFAELTNAARELGETTVFTATEVGKLQEEFARLGFTTDEIMAAQNATLALAAATGENLKSAAAIAGSSLRAFGLEAEQIVRVTNVMGEAFTGSALNLERFTQSMKFAAPVAKTAGFTIEETSSMLMILADAGLHGSIAGNALKNIFLRLGDANSKLNESIGHTVHGLPQLIVEMEKMRDATFGLTEATDLLDKRSAPAFLVLLRNLDELKLRLDLLNTAEGSISRMAAIRLDTLAGDFTLLKSATEGLGIAVGATFDFDLRKALQSFTEWIQALASNESSIRRLRSTFNGIARAIKYLIIRFAALKAITLVTTFSFKGMLKGVRLLAISMRGLATGTYSASTAMKGFRAALASTGVGALVVGVGFLVGYMLDLSSAADEATHSVNRLTKAFEDDLAKAQTLNEASSERHDLLREIVATYGDLIKGIDLETKSNEELLEIQEMLQSTRLLGDAQNIIITEKSIAATKLLMREEKSAHATRISQIKKEQETGSKLVHRMTVKLTPEDLIAEEIKQYEKQKAIRQQELIDFKAANKEYRDEYDKSLIEEAGLRNIDLAATGDYRAFLEAEYRLAFEAFRASNEEEKKEYIKKNTIKRDDMQLAQDLFLEEAALNEMKDEMSEETVKKATEAWNAKFKNASEQTKMFNQDFKENSAEMTIQLSEFKQHVSDLSLVLDDSGDSYDKSALAGFRLQNTKDRLKELKDIQIATINDVFEKEKEIARRTIQVKKEKFKKEGKLIATNIKSIEGMVADSSSAQIRAEIKANKNKYAALRNIDRSEWDRYMDGEGVKHQEYLDLLQKMLDEERAKKTTNDALIDALEKMRKNAELKLLREHNKKIADLKNDKAAAELQILELSVVNFGQIQKAKVKLAQDRFDTEKKDLKAARKLNEISEEKYNAKMAEANARLLQAKSDNLDAYKGKIKEVYGQIAGLIMDAMSNVYALRIQNIEEGFDREVTDAENIHSRKLEIAEAAGHDTAAMQQTHDDKMLAIEDTKDEKVRAMKKDQFKMEKANSIIMAIINGAEAMTKVSAQTGVATFVFSPLVAALVAAQIGVIASQKFVGAKGGIIPGDDSKFADGGMVHGASHKQGGVKFGVGGRVVELEGGEAVINKRSTAMFHGQLSAMNHAGGGKRFAQGGVTPGTRTMLNSAKDTWSAKDIATLISTAINEQQVYVTEADITTTQQVVNISEGMSTIFK